MQIQGDARVRCAFHCKIEREFESIKSGNIIIVVAVTHEGY